VDIKENINKVDSKGNMHGPWKHDVYGIYVYINYNHGVAYGKFKTTCDGKLKRVGYISEGERLEYEYGEK